MDKSKMRYLVWIVPVVVVLAVWMLSLIGRVGLQMFLQSPFELVLRSVFLVLGWVLGWKLFNLDVYLKRFKVKILPVFDSWNEAIRSVLVFAAVVVLGVWLISSGMSVLGWGAVMSLQLRMVWELFWEKDYRFWYRNIGREVSSRENQLLLIVAVVVFLWQLLQLAESGL